MNQLFTNPLISSNLFHQTQTLTQPFPFQNPLQIYYSQFQVPYNFAPIHNYQSQQQMLFYSHNDQIIQAENSTNSKNVTLSIQYSPSDNQFLNAINQHLLNKQTIREYILLIIDDHTQIHHITQKLREINQTQLAQILEILAMKQQQQIKSREELIKFCLRKAFRFIFKSISEKNNISKTNLKTARQEFLQIIEQEIKIPLILPFRKNSKNKTMNNDFLKQLFSSQIFQTFYREFLDHFDDAIKADRKNKIDKLQDKIWMSLRNNSSASIDIKRLPWSFKNTERVKTIAFELMTFSQNHQN
ncbi:unnamed protein product [Paramecium sonneborni]|uniref:Uncharacterized protein n=1 Tax=Paramecium sonneborni TaxID=65129 RepID=A0A8S1QP70_9CILI|nr:unnamed protein product [Paramecium sonneborni]